MRPIIAITMGDPCGIGPEIIAAALNDRELYEVSRPLVIGNTEFLKKAALLRGYAPEFNPITDVERGLFEYKTVDVVEISKNPSGKYAPGEASPEGGAMAYSAIEKSVGLWHSAGNYAVVTGPVNKVALRMAGVPHVGHTEIFGALTETADPLTMFQTLGMRVFFLTRHVPLREACGMVTKERVLSCIRRCDAELRALGARGTLAVAGLNPHCGDGGMFGGEENEISLAVLEAAKSGIRVEGPVPADSVFHFAKTGRYSAVLSLYHDQGHIAAKTLDFERTVSVTLGLPFLRASVDHGTAFDIAWKGKASPVGMIEAVRLAAEYAGKPRQNKSRDS